MTASRRNRRRSRRHTLPDGWEGSVEFDYPEPGEHRCVLPLRDVSDGGLSFVFDQELPGIEIGRIVKRVTVRAGRHVIRGDFVIIHFTPDAGPGSVCGVLFYPIGDAEVLKLRRLTAELTARTRETPPAA